MQYRFNGNFFILLLVRSKADYRSNIFTGWMHFAFLRQQWWSTMVITTQYILQ